MQHCSRYLISLELSDFLDADLLNYRIIQHLLDHFLVQQWNRRQQERFHLDSIYIL